MTNESRALVTRDAGVLAEIEAIDEQLVIQSLTRGLTSEVSKKWVYRFPQKGGEVVGLSIDGVQEAARHLATKGEVIEQVWVHMDDQNEKEAYFTACAVRYAVSPDGVRVQLDQAIRSKRQPKYIKLREGGEQFNEFWFEIGVAKANRNAVEALLPEAIKQHMIAFAGKSGPKVETSPEQPKEPTRQTKRAEKPGGADVQAEILMLTKRLESETDDAFEDKVKTELRETYPGPLSKQSEAQLNAIRDRLKEALGEAVEEPEAATVV